ncbi:helicase-associated domain-containing protein [Cellulomonas sp. HZM]|uniref:helicase-associated domain-containing protein n=1 Tax=Cellulomonas sp. HZM TaxID=1454010 RepID=UPI000492F967|nr:helicase-associated domain-containing protein [Cellulomonas sp. HZM]
MSTFTAYLRSRPDDELVALLQARSDLASPAPGNVSSLGVRATSRASLERALAGVDAGVLQVVEAVVALGPDVDLRAAIARDADDLPLVDAALAQAVTLALVWSDDDDGRHAAPGLAELLGPYPAGLAPAVAAPRDVDLSVLADAPRGAEAILDALTWGPPVGVAPAAAAGAIDWLVRHHLLTRTDARHVLLPRAVALRLREGRSHPAASRPPAPLIATRASATVDAESAAAGEHLVRLVARLLRTWEQTPPGVLRAGGLGVRELRRVVQTLDVDERLAALVVEVAGAAGLVADDGDEQPSFVPTVAFDEWSALPLPQRWARLAAAWLASPRAAWLVGTRDDGGGVRAALDPELVRPWAARLRRSVLESVAGLPHGAAPDDDAVRDLLAWRTPRAVPPASAVAAVLQEAGALGVLGAGALGGAGRALLSSADDAATAFDAALPPAVDEILLQGDLTGIVPGRPSDELDDLVERTAHVESRGGAVTVRFSADSVRPAFDAGATADSLLADLAVHARGPVPQPLEYLVRDAARTHGRLRTGSASSYLRADDPTLLAGLADDPRLSGLGLFALAPTVLASPAPARELLDTLRAHGLAPVAETPDGHVVHLAPQVRRVVRRDRRGRPRTAEEPAAPDLATVVARLRTPESTPRAAPAPVSTSGPAPRGTDQPGDALVLLREAAENRTQVWVELVGPTGRPEERLVRPLRVDGGRLRAVDARRESELSVAVHRIASVRPYDPTTEESA